MYLYLYLYSDWKRFAQSAGTLSKVVVQLMICVGSCLPELSYDLEAFCRQCASFGMFFGFHFEFVESFWEQFWRFWSALSLLFGVNTNAAAPQVSQERPKTASPFRTHILKIILDVMFSDFPFFAEKVGVKNMWLFKRVFDVFYLLFGAVRTNEI